MNKNHFKIIFIINLCLLGGITDIVSLILVGAFSGHLTGNAVLFVFHFSARNFSQSIIDFSSLAAFTLSTLLAMLFFRKKEKIRYIWSLILESFLLLATFILLKIYGSIFSINCLAVALLSFALGFQNGAFLRIFSPLHTSYITGPVTSFLQLLVKEEKDEDEKRALKITALTIFFFILGAIIGSYLGLYLGVYALLISIFFLLLNLLLTFWLF